MLNVFRIITYHYTVKCYTSGNMRLYNTLARKVEDFKPLDAKQVRLYSCGPTVYDHIHIGNLSAFIAADTLRRVIKATGYDVRHVMNFTDVDDKTIRRSQERYSELNPQEALEKLTSEYKQIFLDDMRTIGNDVAAIEFISAVKSIEGIRQLIAELYNDGFAYIADDGVYFSIEKYRASGKKYGQLTEITAASTSESRIQNDEYDKDSVHDFALWKTRKEGEPAWEFELDGHNLTGRPGWHIECSVMSVAKLGQPFDVHTGGVDLIFPHHENEIAQSTAGNGQLYAKYFIHNEHLLVDGKKMSKSLNNFFTLRDVQDKGLDPLGFRLMVLQSHYRSQSNFTWDNLNAAMQRLNDFQAFADLRFQDNPDAINLGSDYFELKQEAIINELSDDLATPKALVIVNEVISHLDTYGRGLQTVHLKEFQNFLLFLDSLFGLALSASTDISSGQKKLLLERQKSREAKDWARADEVREQLKEQGIGLNDTAGGQTWFRL